MLAQGRHPAVSHPTPPAYVVFQQPMEVLMQVIEVDERDSTWEDPSPRFRVYLQIPSGDGYATETFDLIGADVVQAIDWAQRSAADRPGAVWSLALVGDDRRGLRGLTWLVGMDANDPPEDEREIDRARRMTGRRTASVVVPGADRAPTDEDPPVVERP
jgi:hypothetical protein